MNRQANYILLAILYVLFGFTGIIALKTFIPKKNGLVETKGPIEIQQPVFSPSAVKGKELFMSKCASCHAIFKDMTGPGIIGFERRGPWGDRKNVYEWVRNPAAFMAKNEYARELKNRYGSMMSAFPDLSDEEIDSICDFIKQTESIQASALLAER